MPNRIKVFPLCLLVLLSVRDISCRTSDSLKVTTKNGVLIGRHSSTHSGRAMRSFMGIPYAKPPVGDLRFRDAVPVEPWSGEKLVLEYSSICTQRDPFMRHSAVSGSEDCLYLNVFTPSKAYLDKLKKPLPVLVWFHGGGFVCGSASYFGPDFLMEHDIILVAGNYRVGPLGFLSTGQDDCPGNIGLKDQVMVLKWVQENIVAFGGDPNSVTIAGESAGGATTTYLMMTPTAKGLFHKVIAQSGTHLDPWAAPLHAGEAPVRALRLGEMMGCKVDDEEEEAKWSKLIQCLRGKPAEDITNAFYDFFEWDTDPMVPFPPVVEHDHPNAYITGHPQDDLSPHGLSMPLMIGITTDEGLLKTAIIGDMEDLRRDLNDNWHKALSSILYYNHLPMDRQTALTDAITEFYFSGEPKVTEDTLKNLTDAVSDGWFWHGIENYLRIRLERSDQSTVGPTYVYLFAQEGAASLTEHFKGGNEKYYGVGHADELQYLFPFGPKLFPTSVPTEEELAMRKALTKIWTDFVRTGKPTPEDSEYPEWRATRGFPLEFYRLGTYGFENRSWLEMERGLYEERAAFWNKHQPHQWVDERKKRKTLHGDEL